MYIIFFFSLDIILNPCHSKKNYLSSLFLRYTTLYCDNNLKFRRRGFAPLLNTDRHSDNKVIVLKRTNKKLSQEKKTKIKKGLTLSIKSCHHHISRVPIILLCPLSILLFDALGLLLKGTNSSDIDAIAILPFGPIAEFSM